MRIVALIHQANAAGLRVRVNSLANQVQVIGQQTPETDPLISELARRKPEVLIAFKLWQRLQELLAKECLWMEESRELLHLAGRFGVKVDIQRTILGSIYDESFGRTLRVSHVSNLETINTPIGDTNDMAKVSDVYKSPWLRAEDLQGRAVKVRIESTSTQEFKKQDGGGKERKIVISFVGKDKKLICNGKGHAEVLGKLLGDESELWHGREVILSPVPGHNGHLTIAISGVPTEETGENPF